jgi:hypothetical protein
MEKIVINEETEYEELQACVSKIRNALYKAKGNPEARLVLDAAKLDMKLAAEELEEMGNA